MPRLSFTSSPGCDSRKEVALVALWQHTTSSSLQPTVGRAKEGYVNDAVFRNPILACETVTTQEPAVVGLSIFSKKMKKRIGIR